MTNSFQVQRAFFDSLPGVAGCKSRDSVFLYSNAEHGKCVGLDNHLDIVGRTVLDLPCIAACAEMYQEQDQEVMRSGRTLQMLDIHPGADQKWHAFIVTKKPWVDDDKNVIGTIFSGCEITSVYSMALCSTLEKWSGRSQNSYTLTDDTLEIKLSSRESEVLFLIIRGKTAKLAAATLGISYRTVQQYIDVLKGKFSVNSKIELVDAAISRGYLSRIPLSLFSKPLSVILAAD